MINIRKNVFETNSSSSHSISIGDYIPKNFEVPKKLTVCPIDEGRTFEYSGTEEKFTFIVCIADRVGELDKLLSILDEIGVKEKILTVCNGKSLSWYNSAGLGVNGIYELDTTDCQEYVDEILESSETLKQWLFSPESYAYGEDDNYFD